MNQLDTAWNFTEAHRLNSGKDPALREAACLKEMLPAALGEICDNDLFAGRVNWPVAGFRLGSGSDIIGFYCDRNRIKRMLKDSALSVADRKKLNEILDYWRTRSSAALMRAADHETMPPELANAVKWESDNDCAPANSCPQVISYCYRAPGINLDFGKLLEKGVEGLARDINALTQEHPDAGDLYKGMLIALDVFTDVCRFYAGQAREKAAKTGDAVMKKDFEAMARALDAVAKRPPATLREAIQLVWLYSRVAGVENFGRMDVYLGDFYARDLESGVLDDDEALRLLTGFWKLIGEETQVFSGRVLIGGLGRPNEPDADRFAMLAMESTRVVRGLHPQVSLRWHKGMKQELLSKSIDALGEGCVFPILHNDDALVPAIREAFGVSREEAEQFIISDCGEFGLDHRSIGFPNGNLLMARVLEITLRNGVDQSSGKRMGLRTGSCEEFATFEKLWDAYSRQTEYFVNALMDRLAPLFPVLEQDVSALFHSMLFDDCIAKGRGLAAGARYRGLLVEIYGTINTADSLTAIKQEVYDSGRFSLSALVNMLDVNFEGYEKERRILVNASKYGNDHEAADAMALKVYKHVCDEIRKHKNRLNIDFCMADLINADGHVQCGKITGALPDGRRAGLPLANANNPSNGMDRNGLTALLNSLAKLKPSAIGGQVQYLKIGRELFAQSRGKLEAALQAYFSNGGTQAMITAVSRDDLEDAMKNPENYGHLIVRVGGFCARFVSLSRDLQEEITARLLQE